MKKLTGGYSYSNSNFVFQNILQKQKNSHYLSALIVLKNILQRGTPTLTSMILQEELGSIHKRDDFYKPYPLIDQDSPVWHRIIRGNEKGNYYPAKKFYEELIPKYFKGLPFLQQLIIPEVPINFITQVEVDEFENQQVDFYLPQAYLIIEIDGSQHPTEFDLLRDRNTEKYGIKTVRIKTTDLESENETFINNLKDIAERINKVDSSQNKRRKENNTFISIQNYKDAFEKGTDLSNPHYIATAIIRFQLLILELLENGYLDFDKPWDIEILERDIQSFEGLAMKDLFMWLYHLCKLQKIHFSNPQVKIRKVKSHDDFSNNSYAIKIDFSLLKRYTDENQTNPEVIFVRTDYFDEYLYFKKGNAVDELKFQSIESIDYFKISTGRKVEYALKFGGKNSDEPSLRFLLWNIFMQNSENLKYENLTFLEGQLPIITNALSLRDTIGLLPTGGGKSVCYQLAAILQPAISFVVCPIKSLMYDQKADLDNAFFTRTNHITGDDDGEDKSRIQNEFGAGKYFFIFISPERFQIEDFRKYFSTVNNNFSIAYAVIDEVHCLSEWGHDFRTSYLNLANTIDRFCPDSTYIGLTATASINVLKDIQTEFGIEQQNVKTRVDYTRKELEFEVIDDGGQKEDALKVYLQLLKNEIGAFADNGSKSKCGIIFTPIVNDSIKVKGCYSLSKLLTEELGHRVEFFSGQIPKVLQSLGWNNKQFEEYKKKVQHDFKSDVISLIVATKAFGMGVNKGNVHFTFHFGIPGSMESLYQEAGRAGRDKEIFKKSKAKCYVLFSKSSDPKVLDKVWDQKTTLSQLNELKNSVNGDINTNLFLFSKDLDLINNEFLAIKNILDKYAEPKKKKVEIKGTELNLNKAKAEKAIYRLSQLGVVEDWTINNFFGGGHFQVDFKEFNEKSIEQSVFGAIGKYDPKFNLYSIKRESKYSVYNKILNAPPNYSVIDKYIFLLLQWAYEHFAYNRRKSLKDIYELCLKFKDSTQGKLDFKNNLEAYFKFNEASYIFDHIAENPDNYEKWFQVFYKIVDNEITNDFISTNEQKNLLQNLNRFLQSYQYNTGLDLISGLLRLLLNDYENTDGRVRFESSLTEIKNFKDDEIDYILSQILEIGTKLDDQNKSCLAESLYRFFNSHEILQKISEKLGDSYSIAILLEFEVKRLQNINKLIYGRFAKVE